MKNSKIDRSWVKRRTASTRASMSRRRSMCRARTGRWRRSSRTSPRGARASSHRRGGADRRDPRAVLAVARRLGHRGHGADHPQRAGRGRAHGGGALRRRRADHGARAVDLIELLLSSTGGGPRSIGRRRAASRSASDRSSELRGILEDISSGGLLMTIAEPLSLYEDVDVIVPDSAGRSC